MQRGLIFLLLFGVCAIAAEPKFHFNDCAKVNKGFYRDCMGRVKDINTVDGTFDVDVYCHGVEATTTGFKASDLDLVKDLSCDERHG